MNRSLRNGLGCLGKDILRVEYSAGWAGNGAIKLSAAHGAEYFPSFLERPAAEGFPVQPESRFACAAYSVDTFFGDFRVVDVRGSLAFGACTVHLCVVPHKTPSCGRGRSDLL